MSSMRDSGGPGELNLFHYQDREVRTVVVNGEPWFVAADVCVVLDIGNPSQAVSSLDDDERDTTLITNEGDGQQRAVNIINEPGLYSLIFRSRKPEAKLFKRWVTHEVLPTIRQTGSFTVSSDDGELVPLETLRDTISNMIDIRRTAHDALECAKRAEDLGEATSARMDAIEGKHGWFAALGYAKLHNLPTSLGYLQKLGRAAVAVAVNAGVEAHKVQHQHFGEVNSYPEAIWDKAVESLSKAA